MVKNQKVILKKDWLQHGRVKVPKGSVGGVIEPHQWRDDSGAPLPESSSEWVAVQMCGLRLAVPRYALRIVEGELYV